MPALDDAVALLFGLTLSLLALAWLSRQISLRLQLVVYFLTRSSNYATVTLFLLLLPGIFIHETAHWLAARLLGLKTSKFRVWPKAQGKKHIGMGSVSVQRGNVWQDSLVGLAPLLVGSVIIALIGNHIFNAAAVSLSLAQGSWLAGLATFGQRLGGADGALWAYLLFAIANAMMPSASDREPVKPLLIYAAISVVVYLILGLPLAPFTAALAWLTPAVQTLISALVFTILLDVIILLALYVLGLFITPRTAATL